MNTEEKKVKQAFDAIVAAYETILQAVERFSNESWMDKDYIRKTVFPKRVCDQEDLHRFKKIWAEEFGPMVTPSLAIKKRHFEELEAEKLDRQEREELISRLGLDEEQIKLLRRNFK